MHGISSRFVECTLKQHMKLTESTREHDHGKQLSGRAWPHATCGWNPGHPTVVPGTAWPGGEQQRFKGSRVADIAAGRSRADSGWECRVYVSR
jgi:hypothetical protein